MSAVVTQHPPARRLIPEPTLPIWRLSVSQYHGMIEAGILTEDDPVELLEGWLVAKMPKNPPHRLTTQLTREALAGILPAGWYADAQEPVTLSDSEPEPDVIVVRGRRRDYAERHPGPGDVALVVEVADTTLQRDRTIKKQLYARAGIPTYWLVDLANRQMEAYTEPSVTAEQADYRRVRTYQSQDVVPVMLGDREAGRLTLNDLLP